MNTSIVAILRAIEIENRVTTWDFLTAASLAPLLIRPRRIEGQFPNTLTNSQTGVSGSFTFTQYDRQYLAIDGIICYDVEYKKYDPLRALVIESTQAPAICRYALTSYITTGY